MGKKTAERFYKTVIKPRMKKMRTGFDALAFMPWYGPYSSAFYMLAALDDDLASRYEVSKHYRKSGLVMLDLEFPNMVLSFDQFQRMFVNGVAAAAVYDSFYQYKNFKIMNKYLPTEAQISRKSLSNIRWAEDYYDNVEEEFVKQIIELIDSGVPDRVLGAIDLSRPSAPPWEEHIEEFDVEVFVEEAEDYGSEVYVENDKDGPSKKVFGEVTVTVDFVFDTPSGIRGVRLYTDVRIQNGKLNKGYDVMGIVYEGNAYASIGVNDPISKLGLAALDLGYDIIYELDDSI